MSATDIRKRLGELRPPREFRSFVSSFDDYYRDEATNMTEILTAIPDGADITRALDETTLWLLTNKKYGVAGRIPKDSPNQKPLRALRKLIRGKIDGAYVDSKDLEKIQPRFIFDITTPNDQDEIEEVSGWRPPKYKAKGKEAAALMGLQLVLCDYESCASTAWALSWWANDLDGVHDFEKNEAAEEAFQALIGAFKENVGRLGT